MAHMLKGCFFTFYQSWHLHIGPTSVSQTEGLGMHWQNLQKKNNSTPAKLKISSKIFLKKASPVPPIKYLKPMERSSSFLSFLDRPLEYIQVLPISFSGQVNIEVTVDK